MKYLSDHGYHNAIVHGCAVGLTSIRKGFEGTLVRKEWRLATNDAALARRLDCTCPRDHHHIAVEGVDVKNSENYSPMFAAHVRGALAGVPVAS